MAGLVRRLVVRCVARGVVWVGGGGCRRRLRGLVMGFFLVAARWGDSWWCVSAGAAVVGGWWASARGASVVWSRGGAGGMVLGWHCWWRQERG